MYCCFFDVDGVLLDFEGGFIKAVKNYYQLDIPDDFQTDSFWFSDLLTKEQVLEGWDQFLHSPEFEQLEPMVDPEDFNTKFGAYPVHFITNIPPDCLESRERNLRNAGFKFDSAHCAGFVNYDGHPAQTKADVIHNLQQEEKTIMFVDDHPENCLNVRETFPEAEIWLMSRPFNNDFKHPEIRRARDWNDVLQNSSRTASS
ncbi:MAG: hypothetical protein H8E38_02190 [SAR324 cluster bacterium]|nr:hypothetical protein [SAR324 cluster bacterium]MBL7034896.1 hypothetical protein [SAR324 cluster bacterium]